MLSGYDFVLDALGGANLEKSLTVLKAGGLAIGVAGPPDAGFAKQAGAPSFMGVVMNALSRKVRKQAKALGAALRVLLHGGQRQPTARLAEHPTADSYHPVIDRIFPFDQTLEAMAHVEQGRTKAGKVVVSMAPEDE